MGTLNEFLSALPGWAAAIAVVAAGWAAAAAAMFLVSRALMVFRFNRLCDRIGFTDLLRKGEVKLTPSGLIGRGVFWAILIAVLIEAARLLDIGVAAELRQRAVTAIPALLSALLVLIVGLAIVFFMAAFVRTVSRNAGSRYAGLWARLARWAGSLLVLTVALEQAEARASMLAGVVYIVLAAVSLAAALAFGLGCKDMAGRAMEKWIAALKERQRDASRPDLEG